MGVTPISAVSQRANAQSFVTGTSPRGPGSFLYLSATLSVWLDVSAMIKKPPSGTMGWSFAARRLDEVVALLLVNVADVCVVAAEALVRLLAACQHLSHCAMKTDIKSYMGLARKRVVAASNTSAWAC